MKTATFTKHVCDICGTAYDYEESALKCENMGNILSKYENYPSHRWYVFRNPNNDEEFIRFVTFIVIHHDIKRCLNGYVSALTYENNSHFVVLSGDKKIDIIETLTIEEAYNKYGILPTTSVCVTSADDKDKIEELKMKEMNKEYQKIKNMTFEEMIQYDELNNFLTRNLYLRNDFEILSRHVG